MSTPPDGPNARTQALNHRVGNEHLRFLHAWAIGGAVNIQGLDKKGDPLRSQWLRFHERDLPAVIELLQWIAAGPLGRLAVEASTVVEHEP